MFGDVHEPFSEEFKKFFKIHREEFLYNPRYFHEFGRIHNGFEQAINSVELKNVYQAGNLGIDELIAYFNNIVFANTRQGNERLAKRSATIGKIANEKEFEYVQDVFEVTKRRERTSVPQVKIEGKKYRGRMLSPDDMLNLFAGNITTCCQAFKDIGEGAMLLGALEENAGIFVIEELDEKGKVVNIIGQSLTIRQKGITGEYDRLTFDNIEIDNNVKENLSEEEHEEILRIYQEAGKRAIEMDEKFLKRQLKKGNITEEQYERLVLKEVVVGLGYNDLHGLRDLPEAETVVPDEAFYKYRALSGKRGNPWIDSTESGAPTGSNRSNPVVIARSEKFDKKKDFREELKVEPIKIDTLPEWYRGIREVEKLNQDEITPTIIEKIKKIEKIAYRETQAILNNDNVESRKDMEYEYEIKNATVKLGSNEDWYMIYGESEDKEGIVISDLAVIGGVNSEKNDEENITKKADSKVAILEATDEMYKVLIETAKAGKNIYCNATADTSLKNIVSMLKQGMIEIKDGEGRTIVLGENGNLIYEESRKGAETRGFEYDEEIQMMDLQIIPNVEKIKQKEAELQELLQRARTNYSIKGQAKEEGLDEMRKEFR